MHRLKFIAGLSLICLPIITGCGGGAQWKLSAENESAQTCTIDVTLASGTAKVDLSPGATVTMIAGSTDTVVNTIKVTRGTEVRTITPNTPLGVGKNCNIVISKDGTVTAATVK